MSRYAALLARLLPARRFGMVLGLERMRALLDRLGAPDRRMGRIVHVGGTNGKGSTVAMLAALVGASGARVAAYTSPHLSSLRERIAFDGVPIDEPAICDAADEVHAAGGDALTFFEQVTAIACVAIARAHVDVTILEVGLGGRLDATTAIDAPIAVVTGVAMDHADILGATLDAIAGEKAGIFKPGQRIVVGASGEPAAVPALVAAARAVGPAALTIIDDAAIAAVPPLGLVGAHQRRNAAAALAALDHLEALGAPRVDGAGRARALAAARHPGRFEIVGDVILDGAHNAHGARALAATIAASTDRPPAIVLAVSADKDARGIAEALASVGALVVATRYQQARAMEPAALAAICRAAGFANVEVAPDLAAALAIARAAPADAPHAPDARAPADKPRVVVAGSLFLVGEARVLLLGAPVDPIVVGDPSALGATR